MKVLLLFNNRVGRQVTDWFRRRGEELLGLMLQPSERRRFRTKILEAIGFDRSRHVGAYFHHDDRKVYQRWSLSYIPVEASPKRSNA